MSYIVWDLETTGFSPEKDEVIEIGIMVVDGDTVEKKSWLLNHDIEIPEKITELTTITKDLLDSEGQEPAKCLAEFVEALKGAEKNITHNGINFDMPFILEALKRHLNYTPDQLGEINAHLLTTTVDTCVMIKGRKLKMPMESGEEFRHYAQRVNSVRAKGVKSNLTLTCEELQIPIDEATRHRAMGDVELTHKVYLAIQV